ncbi:GNAT family N-acetyltransferase [Fangia hongkongensis]|uniref:GNAT family N-acetyltransferase n=1 Tax=Fangia hongkongensis TaxID=270495 RepID=UPI000381B1CC|nr:GNAT family N-acetyltransferase [Fangia hongkongensis]MBK2124718.1 GNAT family N-acetyltransferase [Fangia hongkongensis]
MDQIIETKRLILKTWEAHDIDQMSKINADLQVMEYYPKALTKDETAAMIARFHQYYLQFGYTFYPVILKERKELIGFTGLLKVDYFKAHFTPSIEIGWRIASKHWGNGYAPEAASAVFEHAKEMLHMKGQEIVSFTAKVNKKSIRVMEKIGMEQDLSGGFNHPNVDKRSFLSEHVLYRKQL